MTDDSSEQVIATERAIYKHSVTPIIQSKRELYGSRTYTKPGSPKNTFMEIEEKKESPPSRRIMVNKRDDDTINTNTTNSGQINTKKTQNSGPIGKKGEQIIIIPWKAKIITPTAAQLRQYGGRLNAISNELGARDPVDKEKGYKGIRIPWGNKILKPTPNQLLTTGGDLNKLSHLLDQERKRQTTNFNQGGNKRGSTQSFQWVKKATN